MDKTKIRLSAEEEALITRADWILTKNSIIQKTQQLLSALQVEQYRIINSYRSFPEEITISSPKISKGENYKGLPYLVLDYPRYFDRENIFALRTLFWWGNFFSTTLHLSGIYKDLYQEKIIQSFTVLKANDFFACINDDQWEHHFEAGNYQSLHSFSMAGFEALVGEKTFIKLSKKIPLQQWNDAEKNLLEIFNQLTDTLRG